MARTLDGKLIRSALNLGDNQPFIDQLTRAPLRLPRSSDVRVEIGLFFHALNSTPALLDLSGIASLKLEIKALVNGQPPASDAVPLVAKTVLAAAFTTGMTLNQWDAYTHQHAAFAITDEEMAMVPTGRVWLVVSATMGSGKVEALKFGVVECVETGTGVDTPEPLPATSLYRIIELRQGTAAELNAADPALGANEPAWETDTGALRVGDATFVRGSYRIVANNAAKLALTNLPIGRKVVISGEANRREEYVGGPINSDDSWIILGPNTVPMAVNRNGSTDAAPGEVLKINDVVCPSGVVTSIGWVRVDRIKFEASDGYAFHVWPQESANGQPRFRINSTDGAPVYFALGWPVAPRGQGLYSSIVTLFGEFLES